MEEPGGSSLKKAFLLLLVAVLLGGAAGAAYLFGVKKMSTDEVIKEGKVWVEKITKAVGDMTK